MNNASAFDAACNHYLEQIRKKDLSMAPDVLGIGRVDGDYLIPLYGSTYRVAPRKITGPDDNAPIHAVSVILCKYLLLCPQSPPKTGIWKAYRDFPDAAPFTGAYSANTENIIADNFAGRMVALDTACRELGGVSPEETLPYDRAVKFDALPRVPVLLLFNDADDEFPSKASVLFRGNAEYFLDVECLAMVGWLLSDYLAALGGGKRSGIR